ncbi:DUF4157 domain-containing protein [Methylogaea oryzae]|uniref:eCIS core domain-containing protein n=1 Tax=Methylogaea oryzae TaxID=1295382 RepID=UPI002484C554|nr:DUF4157 domain-containing protein [Methylogaea oryzae]
MVQRKADSSSASGNASVAALTDVLNSPGQPLDGGTRALVESRFGRDFSQVRIHADAKAAQAAQSLNALAFTSGRDVVFGAGRYTPKTPAGLKLLSHELTHVVQQQGAPDAAVQRLKDPAADESEARQEKDDDATPNVASEQVDLPAAAGAEVPAQPPDQTEEPAPAIAAQLAGPLPAQFKRFVAAADGAPEREADAMGDWMVANNPALPRPSINRYSALQQVARKAAPPAPVAQGKPRRRLNLVFIMGADRRGNANRFYTAAHDYFSSQVKNDALIDDASHRNLESVFDYLRGLNPREVAIGNIYLVSHAAEDGTLSFPLTAGDEASRDKNAHHITYAQLKNALATQPRLFTLPAGLIDRNSTIHIKGCNIGRSTAMLDQLDQAFGGEGQVTAPTHKQQYSSTKNARREVIKAEEALAVYYLEIPGVANLTAAQQLAQFRAKYPFLSEKKWKALLGRGAKRTVLNPYKFRVTAPPGSDQQALAEAQTWGDPQMARPDMYPWRIVSRTPQPKGLVLYQLEVNKTNYTVDRVLTDEADQPLKPDESNADFFGASTYEQPAHQPTVSVKPASMAMPEVFTSIASVSRRIKKLPSDDAEMIRDLTADWQTLEDDLRQRPAKMTATEIIGVITHLAGAIGQLAGDDESIRTDLLAAGDTFGEELQQRPPALEGPEIVALSGQLTTAIDAAKGDVRVLENLVKARSACEDALGKRAIMIDVQVVKTEDWLGADEVYSRVAAKGHTETTKTVKLNDGQSYAFTLSPAGYLPMAAPLSVQVFDADWPDADDLIVQMEWKPPFRPLVNSESLDGANYRVHAHFDR